MRIHLVRHQFLRDGAEAIASTADGAAHGADEEGEGPGAGDVPGTDRVNPGVVRGSGAEEFTASRLGAGGGWYRGLLGQAGVVFKLDQVVKEVVFGFGAELEEAGGGGGSDSRVRRDVCGENLKNCDGGLETVTRRGDGVRGWRVCHRRRVWVMNRVRVRWVRFWRFLFRVNVFKAGSEGCEFLFGKLHDVRLHVFVCEKYLHGEYHHV